MFACATAPVPVMAMRAQLASAGMRRRAYSIDGALRRAGGWTAQATSINRPGIGTGKGGVIRRMFGSVPSYVLRAHLSSPDSKPIMTIVARNNVKDFGSGTQPMLFVHGFGCDQNMWRFVTPAFENDYRIV